MDKNKKELPIFLQNPKVRGISKEVVDSIPKDKKVYLVGGMVRNALYYQYFKKILPSRDFDIAFVGNRQGFVSNLIKKGFIYGKTKKKNEIVLKKSKIKKPKAIQDYVVLDIHSDGDQDIKKQIKGKANFTIGSFALELKDILSEDWADKVITTPQAAKDLKNKQIRVNALNKEHPFQIFSCIRLMSLGFKKPSKKDIDRLLKLLFTTDNKERFDINIKKVFDYVGGEKKARILLKKLGIKKDIFDFSVIHK
ncbi:MAG TPA: hypothetical protein P5096_01275 [Patescibacteria group bacterium]|nr:hypothetical protein [Patescibacteria group bacterium]